MRQWSVGVRGQCDAGIDNRFGLPSELVVEVETSLTSGRALNLSVRSGQEIVKSPAFRAEEHCMTRSRRAIAALILSATVSVAMMAETVAAAPKAPAAPTAATYTVQSGDYLLGIASKLKVRLADLLAVNKMTVTSLIYPGMKLQVPAGGVVPSSTAPAPSAPSAGAVYTVKSGDYLGGIASRLGVKLSALLSANNLTSSSVIHPGTKLVVPAGGTLPAEPVAPASGAIATTSQLVYVVKSGDYLSGIAPSLGVKMADLLAVNKLTLTSFIYPGMKLLVPAGGKLPTVAAPNSGTPAAGSTTSGKVAKVLAFAQAQLGDPYKFFAAGPDQWDCSGLTMAAYAEIGISLPHYSGAQVNYGTIVDWRTQAIQPGDLVYLESYVGSGVINHVGIAISSTQWIHAPRTGDVVRIGNIPTVRMVAVRRLVNGG
jgi:LysM repeat protein